MRRRLLNLATILSLALLVATGAMWVRSYWICDGFSMWHDSASAIHDLGFYFSTGSIWISADRIARHGEQSKPGINCSFYQIEVNDTGWRHSPSHSLIGFGYTPGFHIASADYGGPIIIPLWFIAAIEAFPVIVILRRVRRHRRLRRKGNFCESCGYNLTANLSGVCPECGTNVQAVTCRK